MSKNAAKKQVRMPGGGTTPKPLPRTLVIGGTVIAIGAIVAAVFAMVMLAIALEFNTEDVLLILNGAAMALADLVEGEEPSIQLTGITCTVDPFASQGDHTFNVEAAGQATGPAGTGIGFGIRPVQGTRTKNCSGWDSCIRTAENPKTAAWTALAAGIPENEIAPGYALDLTARLSKDGITTTEKVFPVQCGPTHTLSVTIMEEIAGSGAGGSVYADPPVLGCDSYCSTRTVEGDTITLYPMADQNSVFSRWQGDCTGTPETEPCVLVMDSDRQVWVRFERPVAPPEDTVEDDGNTGSGGTGQGGSVSIDSWECGFQGTVGLNLNEYRAILSGSASGPPGAYTVFRPGLTIFSDEKIFCGGWTRQGDSCVRPAGGPASTSWAWDFGFESRYRPKEFYPAASVNDARNYVLDSATARVRCA